ncbi:hypothetical protein DLAC_04552 [Tieghemostelium lacteum]|uniref:Anaphase-promoting complex subunit 13 n=1 Tax=Tieghemostelium lacteum TaxID=361077 RepID=A0A151ZK14_TIELA|nr:hypothetical protein DLAC_04552 [Tieghemostelium lacteum]|eukprot:KYQ94255.1 hypothetical protein DLAC_04552 [Tieghemostelium lacteum]
MSDSQYSLYVHSNNRKLVDIVDNNWAQETLPKEFLKHPAIIENLSINEEFDELLFSTNQNKQEKSWNELGLNDFN